MNLIDIIRKSSPNIRNNELICKSFGIEKGEKDISKLVKKIVMVTRNGRTFQQTVYVSPETGEKEETPVGEELSPEVKGMEIKKYSEKALLITGDTYVNIDTLKKIKNDIGVGSFNQVLKGWVFPIKFLDTILGYIWSDLREKGEDEKADAVQNQKNAGLNEGDSTNIQGIDGTVNKNVSDHTGTKYNVTLNDGTKLEGVDEKVMDKSPEKDDKKISEIINNTSPESRIKSEKQLYGLKPIENIHQYSLQEYMKMHGLSQDDIDKVINAFKNPKTKGEAQKRAGSGGSKGEYVKGQIDGLTKRQLIGKLVYQHYQAVKKAIENGEELKPDILELYSDLKESYSKKRQAMSEETKRKISEALKKNKVEEKTLEQAAKEFIDNLSQKDIDEIKNAFVNAKNDLVKQEQSELANLLKEKDENQKLYYDLQRQSKETEDYSKKNELQKQVMDLNPKLRALTIKINNQQNKVQALNNGGDLISFKDKVGLEHKDIADFRKIRTTDIYYDVDNILNTSKPIFIPDINEDKFRMKGYTLDAIRVDKDTYMVSTQGHSEKGESLGYDYKSGENKYTGYSSENSGYVMLTLDQLVLTNDYYITKQKGKYKESADKRNQRQIDYWNSFDEKKKIMYYNQRNFYEGIPVKIKKQISKENWEKLSVQEKEKLYIPVKKYNPEKLKNVLETGHMWTSFHTMYERFVDPTATRYLKNGTKLKLGQEVAGSYGHPIVFKEWNNFSEMLNWKLSDIKIQREMESDIRKAALETSFGLSNTNDSLKSQYGILVKRQNGENIKPQEIEQLKTAWEGIQKSFGTLLQSANSDNLKLSHSGNKHIFASKAVGMYIPKMKTIAVSNKFGEDQLGFTLGHEVSHWIDNTLGEENGKRYASDDYESTAGQIAITFRRGMNAKSDSSYTNETTECFARALEQYHAIESYGEDALMAKQGKYFASEDYVSKSVYENQLKPLIQQFLQENKEILKSLEFSVL